MKYFLLLLFTASFLQAQSPGFVVNNRILTTVNGNNLSMLDVVKQMDVFLSQYYPQYLDSEPARMQFYTTQWKSTLQRMIDQELMMADAESREVKATDAEVREEIQNRYGPNIMESIDKLGISHDEAKKMVHQDLVVQKIQWLRVTSKVLSKVTTEVVKKAFDEYLIKNPPKEMWTYQFLTLRYDEIDMAMSCAEQIEDLQKASNGALSVAADLFKQKLPEKEWTRLSLSSELFSEEKELSQAHRDVLSKITIGDWSQPIVQQSRDGTQVVRIFHLKS
ncbi:MAG: SurA N-terminal domain-containing protein, partial [Rhabdochlamydiaceae bacterium]